MTPAKNDLPGVLGQLDLEKLNHDGQYYGAYDDLTKLLDGAHPDILQGVHLGKATAYRQYVKGDKIPYGIAAALAGGIDKANYDRIKRAVLGSEAVDAETRERAEKERQDRERSDRARAEYQRKEQARQDQRKNDMADALHRYRDITPDDLPRILRRIDPDKLGSHDTLESLRPWLDGMIRGKLKSRSPPDISDTGITPRGNVHDDAAAIAAKYVGHMAAMMMGEPGRRLKEEAQRKQAELDKIPDSPAKADLPALDSQINWTAERKRIAPQKLADVDPEQIRTAERMHLDHGEGDYVDWKYRLTDKQGRTATVTGNAKIPHDTSSPATMVKAMQTAPDEWNGVNYRPDLNDGEIRAQKINKIEKKAYTVYRAWFLGRDTNAKRKAVKRMLDMGLPREAIEHIKDKYVTGYFHDSRDEWVSRIRQYGD